MEFNMGKKAFKDQENVCLRSYLITNYLLGVQIVAAQDLR